MAVILPQDRNLPVLYYLWSHENQQKVKYTETEVTAWLYTEKQSFRRAL